MKPIIILFFIITTSLHSSDWKLVSNPEGNGNIWSFSCHDNICYAISDRLGFVLWKSYDYGKTWEEIFYRKSFLDQIFLSAPRHIEVEHTNHLFIMFLDPGNTILKSTDGGYSFEAITISDIDNQDVRHMLMYDKNKGFSATKDHVFITYDGWETTHSYRADRHLASTTLNYYVAEYKDSAHIYLTRFNKFEEFNIFTGDTTILFDFNDVTDKDYPDSSPIDVEIINDTLAFAVGGELLGIGWTQSDLMFKTKGSLRDWELQFDTIPYPAHAWGLDEVSFYDEFNGFAVAGVGKFYYTNDGGDTWHYLYIDELSDLSPYKIAWVDTVPILGTYRGTIYRYEGDFFDFSRKARLFSPLQVSDHCDETLDFPPSSLNWQPSENVKYYRVEFDTTYKYHNPILIYDGLTELSVDIPVLDCGQEYYWRVRGYNNELVSRWSDNCKFTIRAYKPQLVYPGIKQFIDGYDVVLKWSPSPGNGGIYEEKYYEIIVSKSKHFDSIEYEVSGLTDTTFAMSDLGNQTAYYWKVRGYNDERKNNWSDDFVFYTRTTGVESGIEEISIELISDETILKISGEEIEGNEFTIIDLLGNTVLSGAIEYLPYRLDVSNLQSGSYIFNINSRKGKVTTDKFIIVK